MGVSWQGCNIILLFPYRFFSFTRIATWHTSFDDSDQIYILQYSDFICSCHAVYNLKLFCLFRNLSLYIDLKVTFLYILYEHIRLFPNYYQLTLSDILTSLPNKFTFYTTCDSCKREEFKKNSTLHQTETL